MDQLTDMSSLSGSPRQGGQSVEPGAANQGAGNQGARVLESALIDTNPPTNSAGSGFNNIRVGQKLAGLIALLLLALAVSALTSFLGFRTMRYQLYNIYEFMLVPIVEINRAGSTLLTLADNYATLQSGAMTMQAGFADTITAAETLLDQTVTNYDTLYLTTGSQEFSNTLRSLGQLGLQEREVAAFSAFKESYSSYKTLREQLAGNPAVLTDIVTTLAVANTAWTELLKVNDDFAGLSYRDAVGSYERSLRFLFGIALLGLVTAIILGTLIVRSLTGRLQNLTRAAERLERGEFQGVTASGRDEIGQLSTSFNNAIFQLKEANVRQEAEIDRGQQLQNNIGDFLNVAMDIAQGDFTKRGQVSEDALGNVVDAINFMTEELGYVLKDVQDATESVNQGATEMFGTADLVARSAEVQAVEAQKARADVQDIRSAMRQVSEEMNLSAESANKALTASKEGQQAVVQTLNGMQDIRREVQAVSKRVKNLGDRSLEISEIVETISRISEQTNLLAVNAAIESSGAGEAGLRFAVVADQVRKLAEESAYAAERVSVLIKTVQDEVQEVITGVEAGTREVEEGYRVASQAGQRLEDIATIVEKSAALAQRISQATQEQVSRVEQVGQVVEQMAEISQASQTTVTRGREAAERLQQLAAQLSDNLSRFRLA